MNERQVLSVRVVVKVAPALDRDEVEKMTNDAVIEGIEQLADNHGYEIYRLVSVETVTAARE